MFIKEVIPVLGQILSSIILYFPLLAYLLMLDMFLVLNTDSRFLIISLPNEFNYL